MSTFPDVTFTGILAYKKNHVYISSVSDELAEQNVDHTAIFRWLDGKWAHKSVDVAVRGMCVQEGVKLSLLNMGINGKIVEFTFPGENVEHVDLSENGPSDLLHLRCMAKIGNHIFVAGMARRVYRRDGVNRWTVIDNGVFVPKEAREKSVGFNSIDGLAENSICAVGYGGEIWNFDSKKWKQEERARHTYSEEVKRRLIEDGKEIFKKYKLKKVVLFGSVLRSCVHCREHSLHIQVSL